MDIGKIPGHFSVDTASLGPILLDLRTVGFLRWFEAGRTVQTWRDGRTFLRVLLAERARGPEALGAAIGEARVQQIGDAELDVIAAAIFAASRPSLELRTLGQDKRALQKIAPSSDAADAFLLLVQSIVSDLSHAARQR